MPPPRILSATVASDDANTVVVSGSDYMAYSGLSLECAVAQNVDRIEVESARASIASDSLLRCKFGR